MALQTSGPISLNDINIELPQKNSGDFISMNDNYVRDLIGKIAGTTMSLSEWYGASAQEIQTVTVGIYSEQYVSWFGYNRSGTPNGIAGSTNTIGSISDGTSSLYNEALVLSILNLNNGTNFLNIAGNVANSGWTSMQIGTGPVMLRSAAAYAYNSTNNWTQWTWDGNTGVGGNYFGTTTGVNVQVVFA